MQIYFKLKKTKYIVLAKKCHFHILQLQIWKGFFEEKKIRHPFMIYNLGEPHDIMSFQFKSISHLLWYFTPVPVILLGRGVPMTRST